MLRGLLHAVDLPRGDTWTWAAIEADTKLIVSYFVGDRSRLWSLDHIAERIGARQAKPMRRGPCKKANDLSPR